MRALLKKDFLLIRKQIYIVLLFQIILTPALLYQIQNGGIIGGYLVFFLMQFVSVLVLQNTISVAETADVRAVAYLCVLPYKRRMLVIDKYLFDIGILVIYSLIYAIESKLIPVVPELSAWKCLLCVLGVIVYRGVYIPLEYKFGYEKTKFATTIFGLAVPFGFSFLMSKIKISPDILSFFSKISNMLMLIIVVIACIVIEIISCMFSVKNFEGKDL